MITETRQEISDAIYEIIDRVVDVKIKGGTTDEIMDVFDAIHDVYFDQIMDAIYNIDYDISLDVEIIKSLGIKKENKDKIFKAINIGLL